MIINNTHVQGIFLYSSDIEYERGDFVVLNNILYICTAENPTNTETFTVMGRNPESDKSNFTVYLGDRIESAEDYFKYVENPNDYDDKYVSSHSLTRILSYYMSGFNEKGIISSFIDYDGSNYSYSSDLSKYLEGVTNDPLNVILEAEDLNNAIFRISRNIISGTLLPEIDPEKIEGFNANDLNGVILKQYTYYDSGNQGVKYRVQELIDHVNAVVLYRYSSDDFSKISDWKSSFVDTDFKKKIDTVRNYYEDKEKELIAEKSKLLNNFGFRNVKITKRSDVVLQCSNSSNAGYVDVSEFSANQSCVLTIIVQENELGIFKNTSITIDIADSFSDSVNSYYISDTNTLTVGTGEGNDINQSITLTVSSGRIINVYYRQFYKGN